MLGCDRHGLGIPCNMFGFIELTSAPLSRSLLWKLPFHHFHATFFVVSLFQLVPALGTLQYFAQNWRLTQVATVGKGMDSGSGYNE